MMIRLATPSDHEAFKNLNLEWIHRYFEVEKKDIEALENPAESILKSGGLILVAELDGEIIGTVALQKMTNDPDYDFELAKMAVSPRAQGMGIGYQLGQALIDQVRQLGGKRIFLETNTSLLPAISLYRKLGFAEIANRPSPYARSDFQMALILE